MEWFSWILNLIAIAGLVLVAKDKKEGIYYYFIANTAFCAVALNEGMYQIAIMFALYVYPCIKALKEWK